MTTIQSLTPGDCWTKYYTRYHICPFLLDCWRIPHGHEVLCEMDDEAAGIDPRTQPHDKYLDEWHEPLRPEVFYELDTGQDMRAFGYAPTRKVRAA